MASDSKSVFYEPSKSNAYQGRLFYDANQEDYPIDNWLFVYTNNFDVVLWKNNKNEARTNYLIACFITILLDELF